MQLETRAPGYWLVHIVVLPIGLQIPLVPWVLSLAPPLGALWSIQQLTVSIYFCVCYAATIAYTSKILLKGPHSSFYEGVPPPTHTPHSSSIPLSWGMKPPQEHGPPFPFMPDKAILCYICSWWVSPWALLWVQLVDIVVLHMGLQSSSVPSFLPLTPPLGSLGSVQWWAVSICIFLSQVLAEPLRGHPYQAPVSKCILASAIVSGFGVCRWDGTLGGAGQSLDGLSFNILFNNYFKLDEHRNNKTKDSFQHNSNVWTMLKLACSTEFYIMLSSIEKYFLNSCLHGYSASQLTSIEELYNTIRVRHQC
jgi:hypothetical protein